MLVRAAEDIEPLLQLTRLVSVSHSSSSTSLPVHINDPVLNVLAIVVFFLLYLASSSTVCLYSERKLSAHAPSLLLSLW